MKQSKTVLKELTAAYRAVLRHGILCNAIALGLVAMPAMATEYTDIIDIRNNTDYQITDDVNITNNAGHGILVTTQLGDTTYAGSILTINTDNVNISTDMAAIFAQHRTENGPNDDPTKILISAETINLTGQNGGGGSNSRKSDGYGVVTAMSQGVVDLNGNTTITANPNLNNDAILARGNAIVLINKDTTDKLTKINGNIDFNYNAKDSGSTVNANVDVTLNGSESYWTGNTVMSYDTIKNATKMHQNETTIRFSDGATWNATKISDIETDTDGGYFYTALNNLNINKGTVNIADTTRGINVENVNVADATFNGGPLNIGTMNLTGGESVFNTNIIGLNDESSLDVKSGASMDIGTNSINVNTITLDGNMFATLRDGDDAQITAGKFDGKGKLNLTMSKAGKYHVFGKRDFENILSANAVYELNALDDGYIEAIVKSTEAIAGDTHIAHESAAAVSHIASAASVSESKQLQELSLKLQERLANGDTASVEHATKAIHPETESVAQSVSSSVQNTVVNAAAARMAMPAIGRSAGDVNLTSGAVWAQGIFNKTKQNDAFHGYTRGIAAGLDGTINKVWTIGAAYSFAHSDVTGSARDTEIDSNTLFLYGQYKPSEWYLNAIANYTWSDYSEKGSVIDGALVSADYDVQSFGGHIATGYNFDNGITPELGLRYMHVNADDYTNSYGIKTSMKDTDFLTGMAGAKYAFDITSGKHAKFTPELKAGVKYDLLSDKSVATIAMPGVNAYSLDGNRLNRLGGEFGIGLGMTYDNLQLSVNYDIDVRKDYTSQTGMLKFRYSF